MLHVRRIYISPGHNFFGRRGQTAGTHSITELDAVECVAGMGLKGDRFYGYRPEYRGQVTFVSAEVCEAMKAHFGLPEIQPSSLRRNILVEGLDLNTLIGKVFTLQGVELQAMEECRPCFWMNQAIAPGAEDWLKGRGGLRCRILSSGWIQREVA